MSPRTETPSRQRRPAAIRRSSGQAAVEYLVVLAFGVMVLMRPFSFADATQPGAPANEAPALQQLATALKNYHRHYSYAMAIATIPECDYQTSVDKTVDIAGILAITGGTTVGFDRCIDWQNPALPGMTFDATSLSLGLSANIRDTIQNLVVSYINDSINSFINPSGLLGDLVSFDIGDFF